MNQHKQLQRRHPTSPHPPTHPPTQAQKCRHSLYYVWGKEFELEANEDYKDKGYIQISWYIVCK